MPARRDKTTGLPLPSPVVPVDTICFKMQIPNALEYRTALKGILSDLGRAWTWSQTIGQDNEDAHTAAELWRAAIATATYDEDCEADMSCLDVANCIDTDEATQTAIASQVSLNGAAGTNIYNTSYIGAPMTAAQRNTGISKTTDCDEDELFGSVSEIVRTLNTNNEDFLDVIQLTDNVQQRLSKVIKAIPLLNEVPIDEALDFLSQITVEIKENYEAEYTTALFDTYRCELFCIALAKPDCELTFQDMVEYFNNRIGTSLDPVNFFLSLVEYFIAGTWSGTTVVDILTLIQLSVWQQASNWTGISLRTLQVVGLLGANDPDHDWAVLPCGCGVETPNLDIRNADPSTYNSVITFLGHPEGHPEQDIWSITSVTALTNSAYVGYYFKDQTNTCMEIVSYTAPSSECYAACVPCGGGFIDNGGSHPFGEESQGISGNTRTPAVPNEGTVGSVFTFVLDPVE